MAADFVWPVCTLTPADITASPVSQNTSGGQSLTGREQVIGNTPGRWTISLSGVRLQTKQQVKCWEALQAALDGRNKTILVPILGSLFAPWPVVNGKEVRTYGDIPFDDGSLFDDGAGFYLPVIDAVTVGTVAVGAVTAQIQVNYGAELEARNDFGVGDYAYRITEVLSVDETGDAPIYSVKFRLPAREAIPDGTSLDFDKPMIRCRLASDDGMVLNRKFWKYGDNASVSFVEDV